ncbi:uncharacterized protein LOC113005184 [Solenopsis invicta]|uniref:uncharacterized protein LOC113005184 n=1 Tax=Solenopsis invicta TaxID=13686 RepID=UPI00193CB065|nr:uncharacterized protein LOC113005184 [Solenopsis invicta]
MTNKVALSTCLDVFMNHIKTFSNKIILNKDKENCWINITREFNSNCISEHRDVNSLKNCWDNLKKKTRKHYAEIRSEIFKTGGGKANITADDPIAERVKTIIQPSVEGLQNRFDSDYIPGKI